MKILKVKTVISKTVLAPTEKELEAMYLDYLATLEAEKEEAEMFEAECQEYEKLQATLEPDFTLVY